MIRAIVDPMAKRVVDIGCGGGIYSAQWAALGAALVTGVDFSEAMLSAAREANASVATLAFAKGDVLALVQAAGLIDAHLARKAGGLGKLLQLRVQIALSILGAGGPRRTGGTGVAADKNVVFERGQAEFLLDADTSRVKPRLRSSSLGARSFHNR